ncbi:hypothetical protein DFR74_102122 [Nocardia puris]|uniref:Secreted protein n=2 Tax=Nocardia puris TaxID=208602 RepID=A0A366DUW2_9NOCA|nr:hypothetical protein DFR74_102122 [Nocardia puris]
MKRVTLGAAAAGLLTLGLAPGASAYPVGPWGVEGPCKGVAQNQCPWSPSEDGLTWSYKGVSSHYDKLGNHVCSTSWGPGGGNPLCAPIMAAVRALPPMPVGQWLNPGG